MKIIHLFSTISYRRHLLRQTLETRPIGVSNAARLYVCGRSKRAKATKIEEDKDTRSKFYRIDFSSDI